MGVTRILGMAACVLAAGLLLTGCKSDFPPVHEWKIQVVLKGSGKPMRGGTLELENVEDPTLKGFGDIDQNGTADMVTFRDRKEIRGLVAGEHRVRIEVRRESGFKLPAKYKNFESSGLRITIPNDKNPIILEVEGTGPGSD